MLIICLPVPQKCVMCTPPHKLIIKQLVDSLTSRKSGDYLRNVKAKPCYALLSVEFGQYESKYLFIVSELSDFLKIRIVPLSYLRIGVP